MTDLLIAFANAGLAVIFIPTLWHNIKSHQCGIPLTTSIPRTGLIALLCGTYLFMGLYIAGSVLFVDIACWLVMIRQRIARKPRVTIAYPDLLHGLTVQDLFPTDWKDYS